ncbi:MAG: iron ABC transporter permease [Planctomycetales bacterium]|nr:iron ABC transporter permease [Planctomycetales bacterium]
MTGVTPRRFALATLSSLALLAAAVVTGVALGEVPADVLGALAGTSDRTSAVIVFGARLPRVLLAAAVGGLLAVAGTLFQGVLRNPLADPYILGASGGAALGAILAVASGVARAVPFSRTGASLAGAFAALGLVLLASRRAGGVPAHTLVLVGVVVNALASAAILLAMSLLDPERAQGVLLWMSGSLGYPRLADAGVAAAALGVGGGLALARARDLDLLAAGEESAAALGVDVPRMRRLLLGAGGLCAGAAVGEAGPIGFVGLVIPHAVRRIVGADHRILLPVAVGMGGTLLVLADLGARTAVAPRVLPVGVFTALLGAPAFLWLLRRGPAGLWARR